MKKYMAELMITRTQRDRAGISKSSPGVVSGKKKTTLYSDCLTTASEH